MDTVQSNAVNSENAKTICPRTGKLDKNRIYIHLLTNENYVLVFIIDDEKSPLPHLSESLVLDHLWETLSACLLELEYTPDHHAVLVLQVRQLYYSR